MERIKILAINKGKTLALTQFGILLAIALAAPLMGQQAVTGTIVNAALFISTVLLGVEAGILIGLIPSVISLSVGLLPAALAPMIPFIILGNAILVVSFGYFKEKNYWLGMFSASFLKFLFLFNTSSMVINLFFKKEVAGQVALMMSWPQLFTALSGGLIAYLFLKQCKKIN
ncbi:MAG: iron hydrogenase [Candidatus Nealsonbacteria bacterium]|nr:iron hydrogenase [Candidatus Nealsonbacteria bacterium]